jgi:hypothetical protein
MIFMRSSPRRGRVGARKPVPAAFSSYNMSRHITLTR